MMLRHVGLGMAITACVLASLTACSSSVSSDRAPSFALKPTLSDLYGQTANMTLVIGGVRHEAIVDTGSLYLLVGNSKNDVDLTCAEPAVLHYGEGSAEVCKTTATVDAVTINADESRLARNLDFGDARLTGFSPPYAIIGLGGNAKQGENVGGVLPVTEQVRPDFISFRFPNGSQNNGVVEFGPLPADSLHGVADIPLVEGGVLDSGYTAELARLDFIRDDAIRATIQIEVDGVYLIRDGNTSRIADSNLALFDSGASPPYVPLDGQLAADNSTLQKSFITYSGDEEYDTIQFTFSVGDGDHVVLSNSNVRRYAAGNPFGTLPKPSDFRPGLGQLISVVGLGTLSEYNFQLAFKDGRATSIRFVEP